MKGITCTVSQSLQGNTSRKGITCIAKFVINVFLFCIYIIAHWQYIMPAIMVCGSGTPL
jgi:hypothetical protein